MDRQEIVSIALRSRSSHLRWIQNKLFDLGGILATAPGETFKNMPTVTAEHVQRLENLIDDMSGGSRSVEGVYFAGWRKGIRISSSSSNDLPTCGATLCHVGSRRISRWAFGEVPESIEWRALCVGKMGCEDSGWIGVFVGKRDVRMRWRRKCKMIERKPELVYA